MDRGTRGMNIADDSPALVVGAELGRPHRVTAGGHVEEWKMKLALRTLAVGLALAIAVPAFAASVHWKQNRVPTLRDNGLTATISGCLAGLGNEDVVITVTTTAQGIALCRNKGGNEAPGQNKVPLRPATTQTFKATEIKNGSLCFSLRTPTPPNPTASEAGCPNDNWRAIFVDVIFRSFTVTVQQGGQTVLSYNTTL